MAIDFTLSDSQQELQKNARSFAEGVLGPVAGPIDRAADGWESFLAGRAAYREMAHAGFTKSFIPAEYGGAGFSMLDLAIAAEELTRVDVNVPTTLLATGLGLQPVIQHGTPEQKERFLRPFTEDPEGDLLASYAFTDVAGGANFDSPDPAGGMQTIARRDGEEWVITGQKHYTTNGTGWDKKGCHLYTVVCRTDPAAGADDALAVIAVPGAAPGITVADVYDKIGHRGVVTPRVHFDQVRVPAANLTRSTTACAWSASPATPRTWPRGRRSCVTPWGSPCTTGAIRACAAGSCTTSSVIRVTTRCSLPGAKGCPKTSSPPPGDGASPPDLPPGSEAQEMFRQRFSCSVAGHEGELDEAGAAPLPPGRPGWVAHQPRRTGPRAHPPHNASRRCRDPPRARPRGSPQNGQSAARRARQSRCDSSSSP